MATRPTLGVGLIGYRFMGKAQSNAWRQAPSFFDLGYEHPFVHTVADFVKAVVAGKSAQPTFADGLQNQRVLEAISLSARSREWEKV